MKRRGYMISFEGISGAGKSSVVERFQTHLKNNTNREITIKSDLLMYEGEDIGRDIKNILNKYRNNDPYFQFGEPGVETCLIMAKRAHEAQKKLLPKIKEGAIVLADRDIDTVCALQMVAWENQEGCPTYKSLLSAIRLMNSYSLAVPSLTFYFDVTLETAERRVIARDGINISGRDRMVWKRSKELYEIALETPLKGREVVLIDTDANNLDQVMQHVIEYHSKWEKRTQKRG